MVSAACAWTTCATARAETSFETAPEAFRHEPVDDWVQTAEIVIKIILFFDVFLLEITQPSNEPADDRVQTAEMIVKMFCVN